MDCTTPIDMIYFLTTERIPDPLGSLTGGSVQDREYPFINKRQLRLYDCACCRVVGHLFRTKSHRALDIVEQHVDGGQNPPQWLFDEMSATTREAIGQIGRNDETVMRMDETVMRMAAEIAVTDACKPERPVDGHLSPDSYTAAERLSVWDLVDGSTQASILREIVGNPFHTIVMLDGADQITRHRPIDSEASRNEVVYNKVWFTSRVMSIAQTIYDNKQFEDMPILADALEEAGCTEYELLDHCRFGNKIHCFNCGGTGISSVDDDGTRSLCRRCGGTRFVRSARSHVRGCWALDLILGKW